MRLLSILFVIFSLAQGLIAQEDCLPHYPTPDEQREMDEYQQEVSNLNSRFIPLPPPGPVRTMAEWEEVQALVITWSGQTTILREIVRHAVQECKVLIVTTNPDNVTSSLTAVGISLDSVRFVVTPFNSIWVRDYGPWTVYKDDVDSLYIVDWIYNRPRENDDAVPLAIASHLNIPVYEAIVDPDDLVHTGGNHLPDGMGTAFSSNLILEENPDKTEAKIDSIARDYLGVHQYIKFPTLPYDGIHHLDMHMRIIDEETIIFGEYPEGVADGPQINENIDYLTSTFLTPFGNPYRIIRIDMPPENNRYPDQGGDYRTYTNSIFINKTILVPIYEEQYDTTALRIYRENLPGYNVVGINCNSIIGQLGALHCITKLVGTPDPLFIAHARLRDTEISDQDFRVNAVIKHKSGIELASMHYRTAGDSIYQEVIMHVVDSTQHIWSAVIPAQGPGTEIQYFIRATAKSGKVQVRPIVAPEGYFNFRILGEPLNQPPFVSITSPVDGALFNLEENELTIEMEAIDNDGTVTDIAVFINGDSIGLTSVLPYSLEWSFSAAGAYAITARVTDDQGSSSMSAPVTVFIEQATSADVADEGDFELFPNPVEDILWVKTNKLLPAEIVITNLIGQVLTLPRTSAEGITGIDFSDLPSGVYFIRIPLHDTWFTWKVIRL